MSRAGMKLRAGCMAFRIRWVEECERKRDEAIASRDEARELRRIADARANGHQNMAHTLDAQIAETERMLTHRGFPHPGGGEHLALAVDNALDTYAERLQTFAERQIVADGATAQQRCDELQERARRVGSPANEAVGANIACGCHVSVDASCGDDDEHDGPCWPSPISLARLALNAASVSRPDLVSQMRQVWAVVSAAVSFEPGPDPVTELSQVRDALYAADHPVKRGGWHPGRTLEAVKAALAAPRGVPREAYDPAMGGDIEPPPGRPVPGYTARGVLSFPDGVDTEAEQHYAEKAIERAREYLISLGWESVVDDHGEDVASMLREIGVIARQSTDAGTLTPSGAGCAACGMGGLVCSVHPDLPPAATTSRPDACPCGAWVRRWPEGGGVLVGDRVLRLLNQAIRPVPGAGRPDWADGQPITRNDLADRYAEGVLAGRAQTTAEVNQARAVLAPDVDTTGTPLDTLARASIDSNRTLAVAAELRWWSWGRIVRASELLARATDLDPGYAPAPDQAHYRPDAPPRPDVWAADRERCDEVPF